MKLITISGPHAAGKEEIVRAVHAAFPGTMRRIVPHTTRPPRECEMNGREYHFVAPDEFERLRDRGEFIFTVGIRNHWSGTVRSEFLKSKFAIIDVVPWGAIQMRTWLRKRGYDAFCVFVDAPREQRQRRISERQPELSADEVEAMLVGDPVQDVSNWRTRMGFDLVIDNPDGALLKTRFEVILKAQEFLATSVRAMAH